MFIKEVKLEGFKSYRDLTRVGPFDPHFNAITGYNGSGKSNIIDAICFVLGLSSLQTVRATCLADLIYKGSGVARATVTLVFDNTDKSVGKCPEGYQKYETITIIRTVEPSQTCKYFLNNSLSPRKEIADMLGSVQLNINQPNFVIMQGKITKVVNMKPKELLFMIEETVGAAAYQAKRDKTQKELDDKERQVANIMETMNEIIFPAMNKQKKAADDIAEFNILSVECEQKKKDYSIALYKEITVELETRNKELDKVLRLDGEDEQRHKNYEESIKKCEERQLQMKEEGNNFNEKVGGAEKEMGVFKKKMLLLKAQVDSAKQNEQEARGKLKEAIDGREEEKKQMDQYQNKGKNLIEEFNTAKNNVETAEENLAAAKKLESDLKMGQIVDEYGNTMNALKQQQDVEEKILRLQTDIDMKEMELQRLSSRLKAAETQLKKASAHKDFEVRYNGCVRQLEDLKRQARAQNYDIENPKDCQKVLAELNQRFNRMEQQRQNIFRQYPELNFAYKKSPRVDPNKVQGLMYNLIKFKDIETWGTAMEVAAKSFLLHVIVDEQAIGKYFLEPGVLPRRSTIHPMDVLRVDTRNTVDQKILEKKVGQGVAIRLLDFCEYNPKYAALIESKIGHIVLVETSEIARTVAFKHKFYSIAKNGDSVDPDGIMQGGARKNGGEWLKAADTVRNLHEQISLAKEEQETLKREHEFFSNYGNVAYELEQATTLRDQTPRFVAMKEIAIIKKDYEEITAQNNVWKKEKQQLEKEAATLKSKVDNLDTIRAKLYEDNKADLVKCEKALEAAKKKYSSNQDVYANVDVEIKAREALIKDCQKDVDKAQVELNECIEATKIIAGKCEAATEIFNAKQEVFSGAVEENKHYLAEKQKLEKDIAKAKEKLHEIELGKMRRDNDRKELTQTVKVVKKKLKELETTNQTVDFNNLPPGRQKKSSKKLKNELDFYGARMITMRERLDYEGAEKLEQTKKKIREAEKKLKTVSLNRDELQDAVKQLDKHKMELVSDAYGLINDEFDTMMSTLLPESRARLVPVNKGDLTAGLNINVCIGGDWKESLTELSGGQRSLVALALVLSLCMYKPAPFYVLDEIDAALDLNHTQNIGCLIKERFKNTQFICVSLKDGMFTNANVIFQTSFGGGQSEVRRIVKKGLVFTSADKVPPSKADNQRPGPSRRH